MNGPSLMNLIPYRPFCEISDKASQKYVVCVKWKYTVVSDCQNLEKKDV